MLSALLSDSLQGALLELDKLGVAGYYSFRQHGEIQKMAFK